MGSRRVRAIMTPRHDIQWVDADNPTEAILQGVRRCRHEQIVVARGTLDNVVGMLRKHDLLDMHFDGKLPTASSDEGTAALLMAVRPPLVMHDGATVTQVLDAFKRRLVLMALIYDEYGALRGVVTQADLLEALAGEIVDTDDDMGAIKREDGSFVADGARSFHDIFSQTGIKANPQDAGEYWTLAGFVLSRLGRIPVTGDTVDYDVEGETWRFAVSQMDGHRIDEVSFRRLEQHKQAAE